MCLTDFLQRCRSDSVEESNLVNNQCWSNRLSVSTKKEKRKPERKEENRGRIEGQREEGREEGRERWGEEKTEKGKEPQPKTYMLFKN